MILLILLAFTYCVDINIPIEGTTFQYIVNYGEDMSLTSHCKDEVRLVVMNTYYQRTYDLTDRDISYNHSYDEYLDSKLILYFTFKPIDGDTVCNMEFRDIHKTTIKTIDILSIISIVISMTSVIIILSITTTCVLMMICKNKNNYNIIE